MTGEAPTEHGGHRVVRIDPATRSVQTFFSQQHGEGAGKWHGESKTGEKKHEESKSGGHKANGESSDGHKNDESMSAGPRRLLDVRFAHDGAALYVADFGAMVVEDKARPVPGTGVIWRIHPKGSKPAAPPAGIEAL